MQARFRLRGYNPTSRNLAGYAFPSTTISILCLTLCQFCRCSYFLTISNVVTTSHTSVGNPTACAITISTSWPCPAWPRSVTLTLITCDGGAGWTTDLVSWLCP